MIIEVLGTGGVVGTLTWFITKKMHMAKFDIYLEQAKAKANVIEHEAQLILGNAKSDLKEKELNLKNLFEKQESKLKREYDQKLFSITQKEDKLNQILEEEKRKIENEREELKKKLSKTEITYKEYEKLTSQYQTKYDYLLETLKQAASMTQNEAKEELIKRVEENCKLEVGNLVRKIENEAKADAKKRANFIIAQAATRFAGDFTSERLITTVMLGNDDFKGRIIGKEGRNIKALEMLLGVDIIIDDTPGAIIVSSFNLYRRAIATKTIERLVEDGRIQPARIEEIYEKVKNDFEEGILEEGQNIVLDLGLGAMHPELMKMIGKLRYRASYGQNALGHSLEVAHLAGIIAAELDADPKLAKRAGLLHDIGKALTHEYEGSHVDLGAEVCKRYKESETVINAIYAHHGHEEPKSIESSAVCTADVLSASRPGARREVLESFLKRVKEIEDIATSKYGVTSAYAISAGREVRVMVNASMINDQESILLAREVADEIEKNVQYPGEIKVNVIRELRAVELAK